MQKGVYKMKKIICLMLSIVMVFSCINVMAQETSDEGRVEISFRVGDSILKINGVDVEVVTPFIAGEGTTLVPLRVITEAFGAQVEWIAETRSIRLTYREVQVLLQIDNQTAQVNDHTETLAVAPMLVNDTTMVPLRFISETFGATVGWNEADKSISVVKESLEVGETVKGGIAEPYVGDSYYNWSMKTPQNYNLVERTFDGSNTIFMNSTGDEMLYINVIPNIEGDSLERLQMDADELFEGGRLDLATYAVDRNGVRYTYSYGMVNGQYQHIVQYVKEGVIYRAILLCDPNSSTKDYLKSVLDSFELECNVGKGVYDLSNVNDKNTRTFANELYRVSFEVPAYFLTVKTDSKNEIYLATGLAEDKSIVQLNIYSAALLSADKYAAEERENDAGTLSKEVTGVGKISDYDIGGIKAKGYDIKIKNSTSYDGVWIKRFFEIGDYVYCLSIRECANNTDKLTETILSTCIFDEIDKEDAGLLIKNRIDPANTQDYNGTGFVISAPGNWSQIEYDDETAIALKENYTNAEAVFFYQYLGENVDMYRTLQQFSGAQAEALNAEIVEEVDSSSYQGKGYYYFTLKVDVNGTPAYMTYVMVYSRGFLYRGTLIQHELYAYGNIYKEFVNIVLSMR